MQSTMTTPQADTNPRLSPEGLTPEGIDYETETGCIWGGLLGRHSGTGTPFVAVLFAPSMPKRFTAFVVDTDGAYLIRNDGVRCEVACDPLEAEDAASGGKLVVIECPHDSGRVPNVSYAVAATATPAPSMRM